MRRQPRPPPAKGESNNPQGAWKSLCGLQKSMGRIHRDPSGDRKIVRRRDRSSGRRLVRVNGEAELEEACEGSRSKKVRCKRDAVRAASRGCCSGEEPEPRRWNAFGDRTARRLKQAARARFYGEIGRGPTKDGTRQPRREIRGATRHGPDGHERERSLSVGAALSAERRGGSATNGGGEARRRHSGARERRPVAPNEEAEATRG